MLNKLKNKIIAGFVTIAALLGIQIYREPDLDETKPPVEVSLDATPTPFPSDTTSPITDGKPIMELGEIKGAINREDELIRDAIAYANHAMQTECFREMLLSAVLTETNGLDASQIYDLFTSKKVRINVTMFYGSYMQNYVYKTMGYDIGDGVVYANRFFVQDPATLGSLIIHEAQGHGQGFHHDGKKETSVPYTLNKIFEECYTQ